jgi:hypothetical protein
MTDNTAEGSLEPEVNIHAEDAEHDVKEFFKFVAEGNLQGEYVWTEFCAWFEIPSFRRAMEAAGKRLAGNLRRGIYNRGVNIKADNQVSSLDALCACFSAQTAPLRNNAPLMDDDFTGDVSIREHRPVQQQQVPSNHAAGRAPDDPGGDGDDDNYREDDGNHRANDWRDSRRGPNGSLDGPAHSIRPNWNRGIARDEIFAQRQFLLMYSNAESHFSGLAGENFTQLSTTLGMNVEASQISDKGALKVLHLTLSGVAQLHYQASILPKLRVENMHLHSVLDNMSVYYLDKAMQTRAYNEFHTMSFLTFRRSPVWREKAETEVLRAYVAEIQSHQLQMSVFYHTDVHLKGSIG